MAGDRHPASPEGRRGDESERGRGYGMEFGDVDENASRHVPFDEGSMPRAVHRTRVVAPSNTDRGDALGADDDPASRRVSHDVHHYDTVDPEITADAVLRAQRRALLEARAILADAEQNARDEDLLLAEDVAHEHPEEAAKCVFAAGALKDNLATKSAWCTEPLRPTEEDIMKQRVYEHVHKTKFRRRHAVHLYGDPDAFEALRLDEEPGTKETEKQRRFLYGEESRRKPRTVDDDDHDHDDTHGRNRVGGILSVLFGPGAEDPDGVLGVSRVETRAPTTTFSKTLAKRLSDVDNKRALVMESALRALDLDDGSFENLAAQMLAHAPYGAAVLARGAKIILEETAKKPAFASAYGSLLERLAKREGVACPPSHFRRTLLLAVEDAGVRLLKRQEDMMHQRALETLGWERYQRWLAGGDASANASSFYGAVADRKSDAEYEAFRNECESLQGLLRDLYDRGLLLPDDLCDVAAGFPGSEHSVGAADLASAWQKATFFRGLVRWRSAGDDVGADAGADAAAEATRARIGAQLGRGRRDANPREEGKEKGSNGGSNVVKQRGVGVAYPPLPSRGVDDAAWNGADGEGWEACRDDDADEDDAVSRYAYPRIGWKSHLERRRREEDTLDPARVGVDARDADAESLARLRREERAERDETFETDDAAGDAARRVGAHRRRLGVDGSRIIERALAASSHRDNVVMSAGRVETLKRMARVGGAGARRTPRAKPPTPSRE